MFTQTQKTEVNTKKLWFWVNISGTCEVVALLMLSDHLSLHPAEAWQTSALAESQPMLIHVDP